MLKRFKMEKLAEQNERAFQKQPTVFLNKKPGLGKAKLKKGRYYKNVGLGFKTPREAIEGNYIDKKCPWTGNVSIRGRILRGTIIKMKMNRTIVIRRDYLHYVRKYNRFEKATQKYVCPFVSMFSRLLYWRCCHCRRMQTLK
ncbi:40S ribosomal protein S11 [Caerostris extrusa]|uniref:Small ribosomal subunit protein uS17 n=1 Tax=Caerostris extrusa TaxID=172846 RepID=A0AAV4WRG2_CAEEX|nr:40S ribosomal protein S11 [Caerostris extrusa]